MRSHRVHHTVLVGLLAWWTAFTNILLAPPAYAAPNSVSYVVTGTNDSLPSSCTLRTLDGSSYNCASLRSAVIAANAHPGSTIVVSHGALYTLSVPHSGTDDATSGDLNLTADATINFGNVICFSNCSATIRGEPGWNDGIFYIQTGANVSMVGLTIRGGNAGKGGGIRNEGMLTLSNSTVVSNTANYGGGIQSSGTLILNDSDVVSNVADYNGGGLEISEWSASTPPTSTATLNDSFIAQNTAFDQGGGILVEMGGVLALNGSTVSNNTLYDGAEGYAYGGGLYLDTSSVTTIASSTVSYNSYGGLYTTGATVVVSDSTISNNSGYSISLDHDGCADLIQAGGQGTLYNTVVVNNTPIGLCAYGYLGAAVLNVHGGQINYNQADGILAKGSGTVNLTGNYSVSGNGGNGINNKGGVVTLNGGSVGLNGEVGLYNGNCNCPSVMTVTNALVANNGLLLPMQEFQATGLINSGVVFMSGNTFENNTGGAVANFNQHQLTSVGDTFLGNHAVKGGAIWNDGAMELTDASILSNTATTDGGGIYNVVFGAGQYAVTGTMTIWSSNIAHNTATTGTGGGVYNSGVLMAIDSNLMSNSATAGAGMMNDVSANGFVYETTIVNNAAGQSGGGVVNFQGALSLVNDTLWGNTAVWDGGGGYNSGGLMSLDNVTLDNNRADVNLTGNGKGGGLENDPTAPIPGVIALANSIIGLNFNASAPDCGGTLYSWGYNLVVNMKGCTLSGTTTGGMTGQNPMLGALKNNGGPILPGNQALMTQELLPNSPAIGTGNPGTPGTNIHYCAGTDERGMARPQGTHCDLGAFEDILPRAFLPFTKR